MGSLLSFQGRLNRLPFFLWSILVAVVSAAGQALMALGGVLGLVLGVAVMVVAIIFSLMIAVQRIHDIDKSGWWWLILLVPIVGFIFALILLFKRGTTGDNRFGPDPLYQAPSAAPPGTQL